MRTPASALAPVPRPASSSAPARSAVSYCSRVIAGSIARLRVPGAILRETRPGASRGSPATPASTTAISTPFARAKTFAAAPPARKFATICRVTAWG